MFIYFVPAFRVAVIRLSFIGKDELLASFGEMLIFVIIFMGLRDVSFAVGSVILLSFIVYDEVCTIFVFIVGICKSLSTIFGFTILRCNTGLHCYGFRGA